MSRASLRIIECVLLIFIISMSYSLFFRENPYQPPWIQLHTCQGRISRYSQFGGGYLNAKSGGPWSLTTPVQYFTSEENWSIDISKISYCQYLEQNIWILVYDYKGATKKNTPEFLAHIEDQGMDALAQKIKSYFDDHETYRDLVWVWKMDPKRESIIYEIRIDHNGDIYEKEKALNETASESKNK